MCILKKGNSNNKSLAYKSIVRPILEYGAASDWVQNKAGKFAHHRNDSNWETLAEHRKIARICALFKVYMGEQALKDISDRLQRPCYLSRVNNDRNIRSRKQRTHFRKYSSVNRTIQLWSQLPADALGFLSCKSSNFRKRVRKVINQVK
jgi:hypothetical protein